MSSLASQVEEAPDWNAVISIVANHLKLPDLSTRAGLKKVFTRFEKYSKSLSKCYRDNLAHERVLTGIVAIYGRMCVDKVLRDSLFEQGFLSKITPLLDKPAARVIALQALATITHHGGEDARRTIAKETTRALVLALQDGDHLPCKVVELSLVVLSHAVSAVFDTEQPNLSAHNVNTPDLLGVVVKSIKRPDSTYTSYSHIVGLLQIAALTSSKQFHSNKSALHLVVASLRSNDLYIRVEALVALMHLNRKVSARGSNKFDPNKLVASVSRTFPSHVSEALMSYGWERCETTRTVSVMGEFNKAIMTVAQDHNLYALGIKLYFLILKTEFSIGEGAFSTQPMDPRRPPTALEAVDVGLPFVMFTDSLPHCATAIRARGVPSELDFADALDLKYFLVKQRHAEAKQFAEECLRRNPSNGYFYYAGATGAEEIEGLRWAKKGLKCTGLSLYVRLGLLQKATEQAFTLGVETMLGYRKGKYKWEESVAYLKSALETSAVYIAEAPVDGWHMKRVMLTHILAFVALRGPELSPDLKELKDVFEKLKLVDDTFTFIFGPPEKTEHRLAVQTITSNYESAAREWDETILRLNELSYMEPGGRTRKSQSNLDEVDEDISKWLERTDIGDTDDVKEETFSPHPHVSDSTAELYFCSYCRNPTASLKRCAGCGKSKYCDVVCQKKAWVEGHKTVCKS